MMAKRKLRFTDSYRFMLASLADLVDNMSGIFNSIECKKCMEREKTNSECCFVRLKNNRLIYRCRECKKRMKKTNRRINQKVFKHISILQWRLK